MSELTAKRSGDEVVLQFKIPTANTDATTPADLRRVEVYAHTGPLPAPTDFVKFGTLVKTIEVTLPPVIQEEQSAEGGGQRADGGVQSAEGGGQNAPGSGEKTTLDQGWATSVSEPVTPQLFEPGPMPYARPVSTVPAVEAVETPETINLPQPVRRYYTIVGVSQSRNRRGPFAGPLVVPLATPPEIPQEVKAAYTETTISLSWPAMPGDPQPAAANEAPALETPGTVNSPETLETPGTVNLAEIAAAAESSPAATTVEASVPVAVAAPVAPAPRFGYNVYAVEDGAGATTPPAEKAQGASAPVLPLNTALLTAPAFTDAVGEFGARKCYVVRRVEVVSSIVIESAPTAPICVTLSDTFPPEAPKQLAAVSDDKGVNLIWEANTERDLDGYLVLRGEGPSDPLAPLTPSPIKETMFRDTSVQPGRSYTYAVVAVDAATPPNRSEESDRATEVIR